MIYAKDGSSYTVSHWSDDGKTIYLADGTTVGWNRGTITKADGSTVQMDHYEVLGTKYVPVRVATSDLADFCSKYTVVENGGQLAGGYSEKNLTAYALTAAVDKNTNGLKYATKNGDGYTFSAAHTGTGSGVAEAAQKAAEGLTVNLRSGSEDVYKRQVQIAAQDHRLFCVQCQQIRPEGVLPLHAVVPVSYTHLGMCSTPATPQSTG